MWEILDAAAFRPALARQAANEALWIEDGAGHREAIPVHDLHAADRLEVWALAADELDVLLELAVELGDGEAASLALGHARDVPVATDDRPARRAARRLSPSVALQSTSSLLRAWADGRPGDLVAAVLHRIETSARFVPPRQDPNAAWWATARSQTVSR